MPVTVTDWKRCLYVFLTAKLENCILPAFQNYECLPPPRMKLFGNQELECLQGYFFSRQKHMYILDPPSHHKKGSLPVYHIIFIVLEFFHGIWRFWVYECTCLRIYILVCADNCTPQPMRSLSVPWCFSGNIHMYLVCTVYIYRKLFWKDDANPPIHARIC